MRKGIDVDPFHTALPCSRIPIANASFFLSQVHIALDVSKLDGRPWVRIPSNWTPLSSDHEKKISTGVSEQALSLQAGFLPMTGGALVLELHAKHRVFPKSVQTTTR